MSGQSKLPVETPREWVRFAEGDLGVASREMRADSPTYHTVCFLSQGAAEKFLKGYPIGKGWELEKTHDLLKLLRACAKQDSDWESLVPAGEILNEYITAGRYPGDIAFEEIGKEEAEEALAAVRQIAGRVRELMGASE